MNSPSSTYFELLRSEVIQVAGFEAVSPSDCKRISVLIQTKTGHLISETTLKRVFGFALGKFNSSRFTIDVMSQYCGYKGWEDFRFQQDEGLKRITTNDIDWYVLKSQASRITANTLQALKNRAGIPFNLTIERTTEKERCLAIGMNDFMSKPFYVHDLYDRINKLINANL
jgi:hypothetical protein